MENSYKTVEQTKKKTIIVNNFLGGMAWGIGATLGFTFLIATLSFLADKVGVIPFIGEFIAEIVEYVVTKNAGLR